MATQLVKYIAQAGICSRRDAVLLIRQLLVSINGVIIQELNTLVQYTDIVKVKNKVIKPQGKIYIMIHKPAGYLCTNSDEKGRDTIFGLLAGFNHKKLFTVGRLDKESSGALLITNDGDWAEKLSHPRFEIVKEYQVTINKPLDQIDYNQILKGVRLVDGIVRFDKIVLQKNKTHLKMLLHSGRNRVIRRVFEHLGYNVKELKRISFGQYKLGKLAVGCYRQINPNFL